MLSELGHFLERPEPQNVLGWIILLLFLGSIFVDISKIKLNPWKRILRGISSVFNAEIIDSQKELRKQIESVKNETLIWQKRTSRRRIIEFADECRRGVLHSQQMFFNVFDDINEYEQLCEATDDPNHVVDESVAYIHGTYQNRLSKNDFI